MPAKKQTKLTRKFFERPTLQVARELLGKQIVFNGQRQRLSARIVEVEAYIGKNDPACHASRGKTKRTAVMFGPGGISYVYFIYGMYHCLNFVTEKENFAAAVLLRAAEPEEGLESMKENSPGCKERDLLRGPGRFCRSFGISKVHSGLDLTGDTLYLEDRQREVKSIGKTTRVGIKEGAGRLWRFYDEDSRMISVRPKEQADLRRLP